MGSHDRPSWSEPASDAIEQQRQHTEMALAVLARCETKREIIAGFHEIASVLREAGDPLAEAAERSATTGRSLPDVQVLRLKEDFIEKGRSFLAVTEDLVAPSGSAGQAAAAPRKPTGMLVSTGVVALVLLVGCMLLAVIVMPMLTRV